jgi:hypothetical protein
LVLSFNGTSVSKAREPLTSAPDTTPAVNNIHTATSEVTKPADSSTKANLDSNQVTSNPTNEATTTSPANNQVISPNVTKPAIDYVNLIVPKRSNSGKIARLLQQTGLITDKDKFELEVAKMRAERHFMAGSFQIVKGTSEKEIITILTKRKD